MVTQCAFLWILILEYCVPGQVYKLQNPSPKYLATLSVYDASNPTKDWGFPDVSTTWQDPVAKRKAKKVKPKTVRRLKAKEQHEVDMIEEVLQILILMAGLLNMCLRIFVKDVKSLVLLETY